MAAHVRGSVGSAGAEGGVWWAPQTAHLGQVFGREVVGFVTGLELRRKEVTAPVTVPGNGTGCAGKRLQGAEV